MWENAFQSRSRRLSALLVSGIALVFALCLGTSQAQAMTLENAKGAIVVTNSKYKNRDGTGYYNVVNLYAANDLDFDEPHHVKLSNKSIVANLEVSEGTIGIAFKKPGTTKLSYTWKGKKHSVKIKVLKYKNPVKSFKIGGKQFKSAFRKYTTNNVKDAIVKGKSAITPAKNWKVKSIKYHIYNDSVDKDVKVRNKGKLPRVDTFVSVRLKNAKTKAVQDLTLYTSSW